MRALKIDMRQMCGQKEEPADHNNNHWYCTFSIGHTAHLTVHSPLYVLSCHAGRVRNYRKELNLPLALVLDS